MSLNKHLHTGREIRCFQCGKVISKDHHCFHFSGTKHDGSGYENIYFHSPLCLLEFFIIAMKDSRFQLYSEKMKLSTVPRTVDPNHLKIEEWENRFRWEK